MSVISILGGTWEIQMDDETVGTNAVAGLKKIEYQSGSVVTANALYSAVADAMDELDAMDDQNPMLPTTPNAYTMENGYFMDNYSTQFVSGGAISSNGWTNEILVKIVTGGTDFVTGDIGRQVLAAGGTDAGDSGTLLDWETLPNGTEVIWIRPDDPATDLFDGNSGTLAVTADGGTGTRTATAAATTGEMLWSNTNVIGGVDGSAIGESEVYVYQDRVKLIQEISAGNPTATSPRWWTTDPTQSLGIIDILVRMNDPATAAWPTIALGVVEVFHRRYTSLYDNFALDISGGGSNALPLATAPDLNNTTGYRTFTGSAGSGTFVAGEVINEAVSGASGIVTEVGGTVGAPVLEYYLVGDISIDIFDSGAQTVTGVTSTATCTSAAPTANLTGPTDSAAGEGGTVTVAYGTTTVDHDGDGTAEPYSVTIDAQSNVSTEKVYERLKYITRRGATAAELFTVPTSQAGEAYRGLQLQANYDGAVGTFTEGDDITNETVATGVQAGIVLAVNTTATYITVTDTSGTFSDNDTLDDEAADSVDIMGAPDIITPVKASPFGTLAGGTFFGARGVVLINPGAGDAQDATLTDDNGLLRTPPNTVTVEVTNLVDQDVVFVADDDGTAGVIDKDRFNGMAAASLSDTTIMVAGSIDSDVPQAGFIRVVDTAIPVTEQRYRYSSRDTTTFTLIQFNGTATGGTTTELQDSGATFLSDDIIFGDQVYNVTDADVATVVSVDSNTAITTTAVTGWDNTDGYEIGRVTRAYTTADNIYAPILDRRVESGDGSTVNNTLVQGTSFGVVVNVRQGKIILPFTINQTVGSSGMTQAVIRNDDTIAT